MNIKKSTLENLMNILVLLVSLWLIAKDHFTLGAILVGTLVLYNTWPIRRDLISISKNFFVIKFFNIVFWFLSYIISIKLISSSMGIREEYLKFSPAIVAVPVSILLTSFTVLIFCMLCMLVSSIYLQLSNFLPSGIRGRIKNSRGMFFLERVPFVQFLLVIPLFIAGAVLPSLLKLSLLTDASFVSDCGPQNNKIVYIRKNNKECYVIALNNTVMDGKYPTIEKDKE